MRNGSVLNPLLGCPARLPLDMEFLNFLIQPRNGVGPSFPRVEELDGRTGWELASREGHQERRLPEHASAGVQVGRAAGELDSRTLWGLISRWRR